MSAEVIDLDMEEMAESERLPQVRPKKGKERAVADAEEELGKEEKKEKKEKKGKARAVADEVKTKATPRTIKTEPMETPVGGDNRRRLGTDGKMTRLTGNWKAFKPILMVSEFIGDK